MKQLTFVIAAALLALPGGQVFGLEDPVPWWDEPLPDDATGFNCFGTVRYENGAIRADASLQVSGAGARAIDPPGRRVRADRPGGWMVSAAIQVAARQAGLRR